MLAGDFAMSDIKSTREGEHQTGYLTRNTPPQRQQNVMWGNRNAWGYQLEQVVKSGPPRPILDEQVGFAPKDIGATKPPRPIPYLRDPENLKLK